MAHTFDVSEEVDVAWCPGCGNFSILSELKEVFANLSIDAQKLVLVSGIGQAAKTPQYLNAHYFNGLHGRALPVATGIKAVNPSLTVIAESGDGDMYGEGGNHFLHTIRRNPDITNIVHNNMVYGLTKGQASPTSQKGFTTPIQIDGVILEPFNPISVAIALDASFVARTYTGNKDQTKAILKQAIQHPGYALVDIFQPCVSFNKVNTYDWYKQHTKPLPDDYDRKDRLKALDYAFHTDPMYLGIFYQNTDKIAYTKQHPIYEHDKKPLINRSYQPETVKKIMESLH